ncbi:MAG: hypothetical protein F6K24_02730 [Okeania sp. SIO2D1]|nr:hypothetical protein [Okeania sp. SIO2D1]
MKERKLLFTIIISFTVFGVNFITKPKISIAEPASTFKPVIQDIKNQLPPGMVMRLPAFFEFVGTNGRIPIYPSVKLHEQDSLMITLDTKSNCQSRYCSLGIISTFGDYSTRSQDIINKAGDPKYRRIIPISLSKGVEGIYLFSWTGGASSVFGAAVLWEQNGQGFMISLPFSPSLTEEENQQRIIDLAISMAKESPIQTNTNQYASTIENLTAFNLGCTNNLKTVLGQKSPDYCRSVEADSGILFDGLKSERQPDKSVEVEIRVFNRGSADGLVEIYDSNNHLVDIKVIERNEIPAGLVESGYTLFTRVPASFFSRYPIGDTRRNLKEQTINLIIPSGGYIKLTKSSNFAYFYNAALLAVELATFDSDNPEFAQSETARKFLIEFVKESATQGTINIFKGEPSLQGAFSLDFINPSKLAEILQKLLIYATKIEQDPTQNPLVRGFKDVSLDATNISLENILDKYIMPGLGSLARGVRWTATYTNIFGRAMDLHYSKSLGEKATVTLKDSRIGQINEGK